MATVSGLPLAWGLGLDSLPNPTVPAQFFLKAPAKYKFRADRQTTLILCPGGLAGTVTIPSGVTTIQTNAFSASRNLAAIDVEPVNSAFSSIDGILFNKTQTSLNIPEENKVMPSSRPQ